MCHSTSPSPAPRVGRSLEEGAAHTEDHARWSRRRFLTTLGLAGLGGAWALGAAPGVLAGRTPAGLVLPDTDRVLVLIQLEGGNDGLNTVVPFRNDIYHRYRPSLGLRSSQTLGLSDELGLHPSFGPLHRRFQDGHVAIVQNVGYAEPNLSHFRSTDIWVSGSDANETLATGWAGRALEVTHGTGADNDQPPGVQVGGSRQLFKGDTNRMGVSFESAEVLERLADGGARYDTVNVPQATYGQEVAYVRTMANRTFRYGKALQAAIDGSRNRVEYPDNDLGPQLASVARLIRGGLTSRIYVVSLDGFDTHAAQEEEHAYLLDILATSIEAFLTDLEADGLDERVLLMTFSEFGRTLAENEAQGTDHASAAPQFLIGRGVQGGLVGGVPDLVNLNPLGDLRHEYDFRQVYASVLSGWFGLAEADTATALGRSFEPLPLFGRTPTSRPPSPASFRTSLQPVYPNPARGQARVPFTLAQAQRVRLSLVDLTGRRVRWVFDEVRSAGRHDVSVDLSGLAAGTYFVRLATEKERLTTRLAVVR
ncbi:MAG: DUF1501 domain-containing protein [Bacteroidota bacterium]